MQRFDDDAQRGRQASLAVRGAEPGGTAQSGARWARCYGMQAANARAQPVSHEALPRQGTPSFDQVLSSIGNTPLVKLEEGIFAKLEGHNPGQSIKDRALSSMVLAMIADGRLDPDADSLCLVTSGSAGVSLLSLHKSLRAAGLQMDVVVVVPAAYAHKPVPSEIIGTQGVQVYRSAEALKALPARPAVRRRYCCWKVPSWRYSRGEATRGRGRQRVLDQHYDDNGLLAHEACA